MILQALVEYYDRKTATSSPDIAPAGFEWKEIPFILVLNPDGTLLQIEDTRTGEGKKRAARRFLVPKAVKKTSGIASNLLWESAEYALAIDRKGNPERTRLQCAAFRDRIVNDLAAVQHDDGVKAVLRFLEHLNWKHLHPALVAEIEETNPNLSFQLAGDSVPLVSLRSAVTAVLQEEQPEASEAVQQGRCLVTGADEVIERLHPSIKGVRDAQPTGANIISFNLPAFTSFGKEQGANAPVCKTAAFKYTTALNLLLNKNSLQRMQVGDASTVFWSERGGALEHVFGSLFSEPPKDNPDARSSAIRSLFASIRNGAYVADDSGDSFYVLGLAPNAARIAIRFWHVGTVADTGTRIAAWFADLDITGREKHNYPSLFRLLTSIAVQNKADNIPPNLSGDTMRCILAGLPLPETLLQAAVRRNRAEQQVTYTRAVLIKACLNRKLRFHQSTDPLYPVALDPEHPNSGYQLGRLFAVLEKIQTEASPGLNSTIRERYYGAASSTPGTVFPLLMRLKNHHVAKISNPRFAGAYENRIRDILGHVQGFPKQLSLADQGAFAIGYYHQQQDFYTKKTTTDSATSQPEQE